MTTSRDDWAAAALQDFIEDGLRGIDLEKVRKHLGAPGDGSEVGFSSNDELLQGALDYWRTHYTEGSIAALAGISDVRERLHLLLSTALSEWSGAPADRAVLAHAAASPAAAEALRRVNDIRIEFIAAQYEHLGLSAEQARSRAVLAYAASLGLIGLRPMYRDALGFDLDTAINFLMGVP